MPMGRIHRTNRSTLASARSSGLPDRESHGHLARCVRFVLPFVLGAALIASYSRCFAQSADVTIWKYTGTPCTGASCPGWQMLDDNTKTIGFAASGNSLYQLHDDETIWLSTGVPCSGASCPGWQMLDDNTRAVGIALP
jgi:hypothetical protein